ncbi:molecular chaperone [Proteus mirabilis]|uniref:fimbrial biogenesis chaperone n=1 Tax=Morganellaceae TaxID=1903414 RepID=UPI001FAE6B8D|nr:molecular chaperone [Proteus mirabilis]MCI9740281.1 molecular chaperone [Proteus mirabilis]MCI9754213.1 molecular chaperone [Proteus mirabilis]MCI9764890.1 molecular chaperone [Proteus mirabilis]MCI9783070.1 molecular chaperone [Proteus mirabilis]MDX4950819.1 molecular chaperone [Proteus mirabilis]
MKKIIYLFTFFVFSLFVSNVTASVIMTGTRVVFSSVLTEKIIQFKNPDSQPYVIQLQLTTADNKPDPSAPFVLVPPVFRMEPHTGQSVRLIANGTENLPENKESIFYLNFTQLPALKATEQNRLVIAVTSRVKIFYRPDSLKGQATDAYQSVNFSLNNGTLTVHNPTGFYISIRKAVLKTENESVVIRESDMLSPQSTVQWQIPAKIKTLKGALLEMTMVNDYGTDYKKEKHL